METFDFSDALRHVKAGKRVARLGWKNPGKYVFLQLPSEVYNDYMAEIEDTESQPVFVSAFLCWRNDAGKYVPYLPSQDAILADDWFVGKSGSFVPDIPKPDVTTAPEEPRDAPQA